MKKHDSNDAKVKRLPLFQTTNTLNMLKSNAENKVFENKDNKCDIVNRSVPYSKASQFNKENNYTLTKNKGMTTEIIGKRIGKKPTRCPCCTNQISKVASQSREKETTLSRISSRKSDTEIKSASENEDNKVCHDPKFSTNCKIAMKRLNTENFLKESHQDEDNEQNVEKPEEKPYDPMYSMNSKVIKRIRKKPSRCSCCTNDISKSANQSPVNETSTKKSNEKELTSTTASNTKPDNKENDCNLTKTKDITAEIIGKRIGKKPSRCSCCTNEISKSANQGPENETSLSIISTRKSNNEYESANENTLNEVCRDPKFSKNCKILLERLNTEDFLKNSYRSEDTNQKVVAKPKSVFHDKIVTENEPRVHNISPIQQIDRRKLSVFVPSKSLRRQVKPNYAEITLNSSQEDTPIRTIQTKFPETKQNATKVPVYRQKLEEEKFKKPDKLYEFDESDSDHSWQLKKEKRFGKRKKADTFLYNIFQTDVRKGTSKIRKRRAKRPVKKYDDVMEVVMQRVMKKVVGESDHAATIVDKRKESEKNVARQKTETNVNNNLGTLHKKNPMLGLVKLSENHQSVQKTDGVQKISTVDVNVVQLNISTDDIMVQDIITISNTQNERKVGNEIKETSRSIFERSEEHRDLDTSKNVIETSKGNVINQINVPPTSLHPPVESIDESFDNDNDNGNLSEQDDLDESFLEFEGNFHSTPKNNAQKIKVISNVLLKSNNGNRKRDSNRRKHDPWRFNQAVKRNPHFIILKSTALPCLKQDMVLDHDQVEKIEEHFSKTPRHIGTPKKSPIQKSILDYVNSPERYDKENIPRSSLFDYHDFSPIKHKTPLKGRVADKAKRNILGSIQDNAANIMPFTSTPTKANSTRRPFIEEEEDDIANCFGFDETGSAIPNDNGKTSEVLPFRFKGYPGKKRKEQVEEIEQVEDVPDQEAELGESQIANDGIEVLLFDDPEQAFSLTVPSKIYLKKPRRKRLKSVEVENEEEHPPKRKKKDMMTKAEEAALEDWAAKFNSMCREIDKYNLEIE